MTGGHKTIMEITLQSGQVIQVSDDPKCGSSGCAYFSKDGQYVAKIYHPSLQNSQYLKNTIENLLNRYNLVAKYPERDGFFAWPKAMIVQKNAQAALGILMPKVSGSKVHNYISPHYWKNRLPESEKGDGWHQRVTIVYRLSKAMTWMHLSGLCHSDLSFNNIFADLKTGKTALIDCDDLVVPGLAPPKVMGTPWCMAPEVVLGKAFPSINTDKHALAVMIYWILFMRNPFKGPQFLHNNAEIEDLLAQGEKALYIEHPTIKSNHPKSLGFPPASKLVTKQVNDLFLKSFVTDLFNPNGRPQAAQWEAAIRRMSDRVIKCQNASCEMKTFVVPEENNFCCPWCGSLYRHPSGEIPLLRLYRPAGRSGQYRFDDWDIIGLDNRPIFDYHVNLSSAPSYTGTRQHVAQIVFDNKRWLFRNNLLANARILNEVGSSPLRTGATAELKTGIRILFGDVDNSRIAYVQMIKAQ